MTASSATSPALTRDFCQQANDKLVFYPDTPKEAEFIAGQLLKLGFRYYRTTDAENLPDAAIGCLYLDHDKTIMVTKERTATGLVYPVSGFAETFIPERIHPLNARLTTEDCLSRTLAFYPRSQGEAGHILKILRSDGVKMDDDLPNTPALRDRAVAQGLLVRGGRLSFGTAPEDLSGAQICTAADLGVTAAPGVSPEQATMLSAFNELAGRMAQMSALVAGLASRLEAIEKEVLPTKFDKPCLPRPGETP